MADVEILETFEVELTEATNKRVERIVDHLWPELDRSDIRAARLARETVVKRVFEEGLREMEQDAEAERMQEVHNPGRPMPGGVDHWARFDKD